MQTNPDLYAQILADPFDDSPRLVYADWFDEHGEPERAEYIRLAIELSRIPVEQCDRISSGCLVVGIGQNAIAAGHGFRCRGYAISERMEVLFKQFDWDVLNGLGTGIRLKYERGFPSAIKLTMPDFMNSRECRRCAGAGDVLHPTHYRQPCKECGDGKSNGSGRVPALVESACRRWPLTDVQFTDRRPREGLFCTYFRIGRSFGEEYSEIHDDLFDEFIKVPINKRSTKDPQFAIHLLSRAAVNLSRRRAGLLVLPV